MENEGNNPPKEGITIKQMTDILNKLVERETNPSLPPIRLRVKLESGQEVEVEAVGLTGEEGEQSLRVIWKETLSEEVVSLKWHTGEQGFVLHNLTLPIMSIVAELPPKVTGGSYVTNEAIPKLEIVRFGNPKLRQFIDNERMRLHNIQHDVELSEDDRLINRYEIYLLVQMLDDSREVGIYTLSMERAIEIIRKREEGYFREFDHETALKAFIRVADLVDEWRCQTKQPGK